MINSRLQKIIINEDYRITNKNFINTYRNSPAMEASRYRDLMIK